MVFNYYWYIWNIALAETLLSPIGTGCETPSTSVQEPTWATNAE